MVVDYLKQALFTHTAVVVPDLGTFAKQESTAAHQQQHVLLPHAASVSFEPTKKAYDVVLAQTIAAGEGITIAEAEQEIAYFVAEVNNQLDDNRVYTLGSLGTLTLLPNKGLSFEADPDLNLSEDSYGLPALELPMLDGEAEDVAKSDSPSGSAKSSNSNASQPVAEEVSTRKKTSVVTIMLWLLVVACVATGSIIFYLQMGKPSGTAAEEESGVVFGRKTKPGHKEEVSQESTTTEAPVEEEVVMGENTTPASATASTNPAPVATHAPATTPAPTPKPEAKPATATPAPKPVAKAGKGPGDQVFHIIVGSFGVPDNAYNLSKTLTGKGFEVQVLDPKPGKKLYRVSAGQFDTEQEAKAFIAQHQKDFKETLFLQKP